MTTPQFHTIKINGASVLANDRGEAWQGCNRTAATEMAEMVGGGARVIQAPIGRVCYIAIGR